MRALVVLSLVSFVGCATAQPGVEPPARVETVRVMGSGQPGGTINLGMSSEAAAPSVAMFVASPDDVWRVLPVVYESIAIPVTTRDLPSHTTGNPNLSARRRLGTATMSRLFDCGNTQGAASADIYDMRLSVLSRTRAGETGGTVLTTTIEAMGRPVAFSGEYVKCSSTRVLEARIADAVKAQLAH